jgi:hypothetical protein
MNKSARVRQKRTKARRQVQRIRRREAALQDASSPVFSTSRWGAKAKSRTRGIPVPKAKYARWKLDDLLAAIRKLVLDDLARYRTSLPFFTVEGVGKRLRARLPLVVKCFMKLNQDGILHQKESRLSEDWVRGHEAHSGKSRKSRSTGWMSNIYYARIDDPARQGPYHTPSRAPRKRFAEQIARKEM